VTKKNYNDSKHESVSIIYHQRNDSPKYFEISRRKLLFFFIGMPTLALIGFIIGAVGLIHTSPFHLIENYRKENKAREEYKSFEENTEKLDVTIAENSELKNEINSLKSQLEQNSTQSAEGSPPPSTTDTSAVASPINLSTLSLFKPIQGQKNQTRPASLSLTGFKTSITRDNVNLQFNIVPTVGDDVKISGHIIVLMKNELGISAYPNGAFVGNDFQINYAAGEPFATQRFRPVDASFLRPRKAGNYIFTVFIFSRTGDLIHYQSTNLPLKI
jgi:hypothetical protein